MTNNFILYAILKILFYKKSLFIEKTEINIKIIKKNFFTEIFTKL